MVGLKFCRLCLDDNVRMHQILGSEVQDVYEKLINKKVQEEGRLHYACYICYCQLKNCQQIVIKLQKSKELHKQILLIGSEMHLKSISFDRQTYGLVNSLMVTKVESLQIPDYKNILKIVNKCESDSNEVMVKDEPHDDSEFQMNELKLDEEHDLEQDEVGAIENRKENTHETKINLVANDIKSPQIGCDEIYNNQLLIIDDKKYFVCNDCGKTYSAKALLIKHISGHKPVNRKPNETRIKIQKSSRGRDSKRDNLKIHNSTHTGKKPFKCQYCSFTCAYNGSLKTHIRTHTGEKPYKCQYCSFTCARNSYLKTHIKIHTGEKPFKCQYCSYTCAENTRLKAHIRIHTGENIFKCQYCSFTCVQNSYLKTHIRTHTGEKPYKCQYCSFTCARNSYLKTHIRIHTGEKPFKCQYCSYTCVQNSRLKAHIRIHTGENLFKCQYCSYTCPENSRLKEHIRIHTGEKPFKCQYCSYTCAQNSYIKAHIRIHTGEKPFKCQHCSYTCAENSRLTEHIRIHTGEKPFKCQYCSYTCTRKGYLIKHIRSHTGEKP